MEVIERRRKKLTLTHTESEEHLWGERARLVYFVATKWVQTVSHKRILKNNTREPNRPTEKEKNGIRSLARTHNYFVHGKLQDNDNSNKLNGLAFFSVASVFFTLFLLPLFFIRLSFVFFRFFSLNVVRACACAYCIHNMFGIQCVLDHWIKLIPMEFSTKAQLLQLPLFGWLSACERMRSLSLSPRSWSYSSINTHSIIMKSRKKQWSKLKLSECVCVL